MNKRQKLVQEAFLDNEEAVIKRLKQVYNQSLKDISKKSEELQNQINTLDALEGMTSDPEELAKLKSMKQSKVYQKQYQDAMKKQVSGILDTMQVEEFKTVDAYLNKCYEEGFLGTIYDLQGQGIPLVIPLDQEAMVRAVQLDSKISKGLYARLGEDVTTLKKKITAQVSRGISTGMSFSQIAQMLSGYTNIGFNNAVRIARTEGHRIQVQGAMDACFKAKDRGADVVKQWDASLDKRTRDSHARVDGEIKELDEKFSNGLMFPGDPSGRASEVINCRCALLQRARWALGKDELETLKKRADYFGFNKDDSFDDFKDKYMKASKRTAQSNFTPAKTIKEAEDFAHDMGVKYVEYGNLPLETVNDINKALATLPKDSRPIFIGDSRNLEKAFYGTQGKLPRKHNQFYGVSMDSSAYGIYHKDSDGIYRCDFDEGGQMIGYSSVHNSTKKVTKSKKEAQEKYREKYGRDWFFNETGETTASHEMGHCYININGLPEGFENDSNAWAEESKCDMLKNPNEAWAEAWASYHTGTNVDKVPEDVLEYIRKASGK